MDKYILTNETLTFDGRTLYRIKAIRNIPLYDVKEGDLGGFVETETNLSQDGDCWIKNNGIVYDKAKVKDNACVYHSAIISGYATIKNSAKIWDHAKVCDYAIVKDSSTVEDYAWISGSAIIADNSIIQDYAKINNCACILDNAKISNEARVCDHAIIAENANVTDQAIVGHYVTLKGDFVAKDKMRLLGNAVIENMNDVIYFINHFSSGRPVTYIRPSDTWITGCFVGNSEEIIEKAGHDNKMKGAIFEAYVDFFRKLKDVENYGQ